jgi:hypothetical protein
MENELHNSIHFIDLTLHWEDKIKFSSIREAYRDMSYYITIHVTHMSTDYIHAQ